MVPLSILMPCLFVLSFAIKVDRWDGSANIEDTIHEKDSGESTQMLPAGRNLMEKRHMFDRGYPDPRPRQHRTRYPDPGPRQHRTRYPDPGPRQPWTSQRPRGSPTARREWPGETPRPERPKSPTTTTTPKTTTSRVRPTTTTTSTPPPTTTTIVTVKVETTASRLKIRRTTTTETSTTTHTTTTAKKESLSTTTEAEIIDEKEEEPFPSKFHLTLIGSVVGIIFLLCFITCCCCKDTGAETRTMRSPMGRHGKRKKHRKKGKASATSSSSSMSAPVKAKKMEAEKINMMEFADRGALVMQDVKGEVKHALDDVKSKEIVRVQYDTGQNEIVTIGSDVEIIKSSSNVASAIKSKAGDVKSNVKSVERPPPSTRKKAKNKTKSVRH